MSDTSSRCKTPSAVAWLAGAAGAAALGYAAYAGYAWSRFGRPRAAKPHEADSLLDTFMPAYDVVERHHINVDAPADVTLRSAEQQDIGGSLGVRAVIWMRELVMGASHRRTDLPRGLLAQMEALGWGVLARVPDREVIVGAVTRPWEAEVVFKALQAPEFVAFDEPGWVKIVWTLRADPIDEQRSVFRTETRALATDAEARRKFRRYWACVAPGVELIRFLTLHPTKQDAEERAIVEAYADAE